MTGIKVTVHRGVFARFGFAWRCPPVTDFGMGNSMIEHSQPIARSIGVFGSSGLVDRVAELVEWPMNSNWLLRAMRYNFAYTTLLPLACLCVSCGGANGKGPAFPPDEPQRLGGKYRESLDQVSSMIVDWDSISKSSWNPSTKTDVWWFGTPTAK